jgi:hypothetical protein
MSCCVAIAILRGRSCADDAWCACRRDHRRRRHRDERLDGFKRTSECLISACHRRRPEQHLPFVQCERGRCGPEQHGYERAPSSTRSPPNSSLIQGAVYVLASRTNVILANPNGITVDGGSFVKAGHGVLSTGQMSFDDSRSRRVRSSATSY